jgi:hypothetical protein
MLPTRYQKGAPDDQISIVYDAGDDSNVRLSSIYSEVGVWCDL